MAAMTFFEGFNSTWAQDGGVYGWEQAQYRQGWSTIGDQKPSVEQFNNTHQIIDQKANYLWRQLKTAADDAGVSTGANNNNTLKDLLDGLRDEVLGTVYPVGAIYLNYNDDTNPGNFLPGTWVKITSGVLYSHGAASAGAAGSTGGTDNVTLTVNNLPAHNHTMGSAGNHSHTTNSAGSHTHTRGSMNITGSFKTRATGEFTVSRSLAEESGAFSQGSQNGGNVGRINVYDNHSDRRITTDFNASKTWVGSTSSAGSHAHTTNSTGAHTHTINNTGNGASFSIIPPRVTVYMFRRTA